MLKRVTIEIILDNTTTALDVRISANNYPTSNIKLLYKIRHVDDSRPFDEIPYVYFNTTGLSGSIAGLELIDLEDE